MAMTTAETHQLTIARAIECWCDTDAMLVAGLTYEDGQVLACPDCGYLWSVSCDSETAPHLIDCDLGFADEGEHDHG